MFKPCFASAFICWAYLCESVPVWDWPRAVREAFVEGRHDCIRKAPCGAQRAKLLRGKFVENGLGESLPAVDMLK